MSEYGYAREFYGQLTFRLLPSCMHWSTIKAAMKMGCVC